MSDPTPPQAAPPPTAGPGAQESAKADQSKSEPGEQGAAKVPADSASLRNNLASAAANNPNRTSGHLGHQQSAQRQLFGDSLNDAVMGDKNVSNFYYGAADRKTLVYLRFSAESVDEAAAFVEPPDYPRVARFAVSRGLVVLTGAAGSGRTAAALHLLAAGTGRHSIHSIHPDTDFTTLAAQPLPNGTGIILSNITARAAAALDDFALRQLTDQLTVRGQKLIITASDTLVWGCTGIAAHSTVLGPGPDPVLVLERQFRWRLGVAARVRARELLDRPDVKALIDTHVRADRPLADATLLATLLADAAADPERMADTAAVGMAAGAAGEIEVWFEGLAEQHPQDQYYAIALAVLNELANEKVADAAKRLERLLSPETAEVRDERRPRNFSGGNRTKLLRVRAHQTARTGAETPGESRELVTRYIKRDYPGRLLAHVWNEYDDERGALSSWLRELGDNPLEDIHIRAGVAVGALARSSYDHVVQTIIVPWAASEDEDQQDAAAVALQTLGSDPRFAVRVRALLGEWAEAGTDAAFRATAARAYGAQYGAERIDEAVRLLAQLAAAEEWPVASAVTRSLTELIATDTPGVTARVFTLLGEWVSGRNQDLRTVGRFVFLYAAADLVARPVEPGTGEGKWPAFLHLDQEPQYTAIIRYLWANALNSSDLHQLARDVLGAWAKKVDGDPRGCQALARLLAGTAGTDRTKAIVRRLIQEWAGRDGTGPAPHAAAAIAPISVSVY